MGDRGAAGRRAAVRVPPHRGAGRGAAAGEPSPEGAARRGSGRQRALPLLDLLPAAPGSTRVGRCARGRPGCWRPGGRSGTAAVLLGRRLFAEFVGTALLLVAVVGSGIAAQRLSRGDVGLQLLENAGATAVALVAIILAVGPVSGGHLNPVVTLIDRVFGGVSTRELLGYCGAQVAGAVVGTMVANLMYGLPAIEVSQHVRSGSGIWLGEAVATFGLVLVVFGVVRSG